MKSKRNAGTAGTDKPLVVQTDGDESRETTFARLALRPSLNAASVAQSYSLLGSKRMDLGALIAELSAQCDSVKDGNLGRPEAMLTAQAHTLDVLFAYLAQRAHMNLGEHLDATDRYLRLAFKAQSQCRATIETLAAIKNPPVVIARQANIAHGPQQVNNGAPPSRAREIESRPNELLEQQHAERLDTRAAGEAIRSDQAMEAVGAVNGSEDGRR